MLELASRLGLSEDETRKKVMASLQQEIYDAVAMARPHTLQGLVQTAQLAENIVHRRATASVKSIQALRTEGEATPSVPTQNVVTRALKLQGCFLCNSREHYKRKCPHNPYK